MNQKKLIVPAVTVAIVVILGFFGGNFLLQRISQLRSDLEVARQEEAKLKEKLTTLKDFQSIGPNAAADVVASIPADNPAVDAISQANLKAGNFGVASAGISVAKPITDTSLSHTDISYELQGDLLSTISFIQELSKTSPFNKIRKFALGAASGGASFSVSERIYFGELPLTLGRPSDPLVAMGDDEIKIVRDLQSLEKPVFASLTPQPPVTRDNPFGI